ncbi:excinuclease ABC subunit UvrC [Candidatus Dependentiae bacterium]|nr:excinuclease ABC subunit UvrC [Candidatus Dependentiae bacterium]MBU4387172.1 excinuclease ABC subunit UvrC [Candidatus Dependentiae bacterium]
MNNSFNILLNQAKKFPSSPGIYIFKNIDNQIIYIGKAKNLKKRIKSYFQKEQDLKSLSLTQNATSLEFIITKSELQAMLLEAELIKANQPKFNILLKDGQPFLYILFSQPSKKLPEIKIVRNKKEKGTYFGPFIDKTETRKVYNFLLHTFRLKLCNKKIDNGCLDFHLGLCAGSCTNNFDKNAYITRLNLAKKSLESGHKKFLNYLNQEIKNNNNLLNFEKSKELHEYRKAFNIVFKTLDEDYSYKKIAKNLALKDIWILDTNTKNLIVFEELNGAIKRKKIFNIFLEHENSYIEYINSYYQNFNANNIILINFEIKNNEKILLEKFIKLWQHKTNNISIIKPNDGHLLSLVNLAQIHAQEELKNQKSLNISLKLLLKLEKDVNTIDCFDISHTQGNFMVGSCVRFKDGQPDYKNFRHFKIKTLDNQNDYAALQEIVSRRYKFSDNIPDLILIDGGKGQLSSIEKILPTAQIASLAKREETVFSKNIPNGKILNPQNYTAQVLIALRDYTHHFAISYHRKVRTNINE